MNKYFMITALILFQCFAYAKKINVEIVRPSQYPACLSYVSNDDLIKELQKRMKGYNPPQNQIIPIEIKPNPDAEDKSTPYKTSLQCNGFNLVVTTINLSNGQMSDQTYSMTSYTSCQNLKTKVIAVFGKNRKENTIVAICDNTVLMNFLVTPQNKLSLASTKDYDSFYKCNDTLDLINKN